MNEKNLSFEPLVAFSGEVNDPDIEDIKYTENSLNRLGQRESIQDAFKMPKYRMLIVANKFQTGFDEPYLHTMYVDKKLGGVNAVQTLSRLNRTAKGKSNTVVLDFINESEEIIDAFTPYYQTTFLEEETDPNKLYSIQDKLNGYNIYSERDIKEFSKIFFNPKENIEKIQTILDRVIYVFNEKETEERENFRSSLQSYIRLYGFISQCISFKDIELEELYVFAKALSRKLPKRDNTLPVEIQDAIDLETIRIQKTYEGELVIPKTDGEVVGISANSGEFREEEKEYLSAIIGMLNEVHGTGLTEEDKKELETIQVKLTEDKELKAVMNEKNSKKDVQEKFNSVLEKLFLTFVQSKLNLYKKVRDPRVNPLLKEKWFEKFFNQQIQTHRNLQKLTSQIDEIKEAQQETKSSINNLNEKVDNIVSTVNDLQNNISEIKLSDKTDEEKIDDIDKQTKKKLKAIKIKNVFAPHIQTMKNAIPNWDKLESLSQEILPQADFLLKQHQSLKEPDYSPVIIQYCTAIENELLTKIFVPFLLHIYNKNSNLAEFLLLDSTHPKTSKLARDIKKYKGKSTTKILFTLGDMEWGLGLLTGNNTIKESPLIQELNHFISESFKDNFVTKDFVKELRIIVSEFRNKSAHPYKLLKSDATDCREKLIPLLKEFLQYV